MGKKRKKQPKQPLSQAQRFWLWLGKRRWVVQIISALGLNSYFTRLVTKGIPCPALNCYACPASSFACPIGTLQHFVERSKPPLYVLGVIGLVGALIGRGSCGWFCPFGWFQELVYKLPVPKLRLPNRFNWTRYIVLVVLVLIIPFLTREPWFCKLCPAGALEAAIPVALTSSDIRALIGTMYWVKIFIFGGLLAWMTTTQRPFCRWICPLGALWSPFNPVSAFQLDVDLDNCKKCDLCRAACPVDIRVYENPVSDACIRCLQCVEVCPTQCITVVSPRGMD